VTLSGNKGSFQGQSALVEAGFSRKEGRCPARGTNFAVFFVDDLGWNGLACQGNRFHETPNIDALAESGMRFTGAYPSAEAVPWSQNQRPARSECG
jgi:hypothetical protein